MTRIAVIDHGAGNLVSIAQALESAGAMVDVIHDRSGLEQADAIVLPGVGATGAAMHRLRAQGMVDPLKAWKRPLLGICVGLQLFFDASDEDEGPCLGLIPGRVRRLSAKRLPHIGWNELVDRNEDDPLMTAIDPDATFYFVHSFAPIPDDDEVVIARSTYSDRFAAAVRYRNLVGVQFHPERSGRHGMRMIGNFVRSVRVGEHAA